MKQLSLLRLTWWLGLLWATIVWVGEFLLHYSPELVSATEAFSFFLTVAPEHLVWWHFIAIAWVPLYFVWYYHLFLMMGDWWKKKAWLLFSLGVIAFTVGGMWLSSRGFMGSLIQAPELFSGETLSYLIDSYTLFSESLVQILRLVIWLISVLWVCLIMTWKTMLKKWMAFFNPLLLLISVFAIYFVLPSVGQYLAPIAMNVVHFVIFWLSLLHLYSLSPKNA